MWTRPSVLHFREKKKKGGGNLSLAARGGDISRLHHRSASAPEGRRKKKKGLVSKPFLSRATPILNRARLEEERKRDAIVLVVFTMAGFHSRGQPIVICHKERKARFCADIFVERKG